MPVWIKSDTDLIRGHLISLVSGKLVHIPIYIFTAYLNLTKPFFLMADIDINKPFFFSIYSRNSSLAQLFQVWDFILQTPLQLGNSNVSRRRSSNGSSVVPWRSGPCLRACSFYFCLCILQLPFGSLKNNCLFVHWKFLFLSYVFQENLWLLKYFYDDHFKILLR